MRIKPGLDEAGWRGLQTSGSYEWWYVDVLGDDGETALVVILFDGMPFSPDYLTSHERGRSPKSLDHASVFAAVYQHGKQLCYGLNLYSPPAFAARTDRLDVQVDGSSLAFDPELGAINLHLDTPILFGGSKLAGDLRFAPVAPKSVESIGPGNIRAAHVWNPIAPDCNVTGTLRIMDAAGGSTHELRADGRGYVDHNYGDRPLTEGIDRWHWGRAHFDSGTLVYYHSELSGSPGESMLAYLAQDVAATLVPGNVAFEASDWRRKVLCPRFPARFQAVGQSASSSVQVTGEIRDILDWGPFYMRFLTDFVMTMNGDVSTATGITEYLDPAGLKKRWLRPLIKTRIRRF